MLSIEFTREDLYPWCRKIALELIRINEHIDLDRLKKEGKINNHDVYRSDIVYFTDKDGSKRPLRSKK